MATLTIRGCDDELTRALKKASKHNGQSVNKLVIETLKAALLGGERKSRRHNDLDHLAGTWSEEEAVAFEKATSGFESIDPELWS